MKHPWKKRKNFPWRGILLIGAPIVFLYGVLGESGLLEAYRLRLKLQLAEDSLSKLEKDNLRLIRNIESIKSNPQIAERQYQRSAIQGKNGTTFYRFVNQESTEHYLDLSDERLSEETLKLSRELQAMIYVRNEVSTFNTHLFSWATDLVQPYVGSGSAVHSQALPYDSSSEEQ